MLRLRRPPVVVPLGSRERAPLLFLLEAVAHPTSEARGVRGQTQIIWPDDDAPTLRRRPARTRPVAVRAALMLREAPGAEAREARDEAVSDALAEALWEKLRASAVTPDGNNREGISKVGDE
jgi:hypothetical protein